LTTKLLSAEQHNLTSGAYGVLTPYFSEIGLMVYEEAEPMKFSYSAETQNTPTDGEIVTGVAHMRDSSLPATGGMSRNAYVANMQDIVSKVVPRDGVGAGRAKIISNLGQAGYRVFYNRREIPEGMLSVLSNQVTTHVDQQLIVDEVFEAQLRETLGEAPLQIDQMTTLLSELSPGEMGSLIVKGTENSISASDYEEVMPVLRHDNDEFSFITLSREPESDSFAAKIRSTADITADSSLKEKLKIDLERYLANENVRIDDTLKFELIRIQKRG